MAPPDSQVAHILELLTPLGGVTARSMFGGVGFFREGAMLGLIHEKVFYLRVDDDGRRRHEARKLEPFVYIAKHGKRMAMPYFEAPPEALDDADEMTKWATPAAAVALLVAAARNKKAAAAPPPPAKAARPNGKPKAAATVAKTKVQAAKTPARKTTKPGAR